MKKPVTVFALAGLAFGSFFAISKPKEPCINLHINFGTLDSKTKVDKCVEASGSTNALDLLHKAGYQTEGTRKYGDAVVCRVDGLPDKSVESCETMPPEKAFWAVIVKKKPLIPLTAEWGWAQKGINETFVSPGDSLGLVFSTNGDLKWP